MARRLIAAGHWRNGDPPILVIAGNLSLGLDRGRLSRAGSAVALEVPRPRHQCLRGASSGRIALGGLRGWLQQCRAGTPGAAQKMTQQLQQHQGHLLTGSGHSAPGGISVPSRVVIVPMRFLPFCCLPGSLSRAAGLPRIRQPHSPADRLARSTSSSEARTTRPERTGRGPCSGRQPQAASLVLALSRPFLRTWQAILAEYEARYNGRRPHRGGHLRPTQPDHPAADLSR